MSFNYNKVQGSREPFNKTGKIFIIASISGKALPGVMCKNKISACAKEMVRVFSGDVDIQLVIDVFEDAYREPLFFQFRQYLSDQGRFSGA